ncbi:hypothetical protein [Tardiphaga robiniae]|uniref:Uncharacterized protein n=1 Tax=Tardiphaga robiniae TaxID=943830 RepID=A0A7G6U2H1_9BRAD|nr:hypothetical protein [Tardiphaga robiniae]QND73203.1 hypothetical protein HB776_19835 [Tardiphaga robiniae]
MAGNNIVDMGAFGGFATVTATSGLQGLSTLSTGTHSFPPGYRHDQAAD